MRAVSTLFNDSLMNIHESWKREKLFFTTQFSNSIVKSEPLLIAGNILGSWVDDDRCHFNIMMKLQISQACWSIVEVLCVSSFALGVK